MGIVAIKAVAQTLSRATYQVLRGKSPFDRNKAFV